MTTRLALPRLPALHRARLWLSYQRYGVAIVAATGAALAASLAVGPWWLIIPVAAIAIAPVRFAVYVLASWPRKLRATRIALHRIAHGRFAPTQVRPYCGDPCFRVVAAEILAAGGVPRQERGRLIAAYRREVGARDVLLLVDHSTGVVVTVGADGQFRREALRSGAEERL